MSCVLRRRVLRLVDGGRVDTQRAACLLVLKVTDYIQKQDGTLAYNFVRHIETFGMNELILTLLGTMVCVATLNHLR